MDVLIENSFLALLRAAAPSSALAFSSLSSLTMAFERSSGSLLFTKMPQPARASGTPPTEVATIAFPHAIASMTAKGKPSVIPLKTTTSPRLYAFSGSLVAPMKVKFGSSPSLFTVSRRPADGGDYGRGVVDRPDDVPGEDLPEDFGGFVEEVRVVVKHQLPVSHAVLRDYDGATILRLGYYRCQRGEPHE